MNLDVLMIRHLVMIYFDLLCLIMLYNTIVAYVYNQLKYWWEDGKIHEVVQRYVIAESLQQFLHHIKKKYPSR